MTIKIKKLITFKESEGNFISVDQEELEDNVYMLWVDHVLHGPFFLEDGDILQHHVSPKSSKDIYHVRNKK